VVSSLAYLGNKRFGYCCCLLFVKINCEKK
jgi:hypothetical protein